MNREEASFILANIDRRVCDDELNDALDMAIKALEQEEEKAIKMRDATSEEQKSVDDYIKSISKPTGVDFWDLEQEPCDNAIDRSKAIMIASGYCHPANVAKELAKLPPVNPQPCEDAISRQYLIDIATKDGAYDYVSAQEIANAPSVNPQPKTGHCKNCKWWKDSDGTYCRGVHAESKCPINRKEVYEGNGYCYMFEPQEGAIMNE